MKKPRQTVMHCRCGRTKLVALGMCSTCYSLKRQDAEHFGGLRETVLKRDDYRCRVCHAPGRGKREIIVHHRVPGQSLLNLMIALCPGCHARLHRTRVVTSLMPPLLLQLWREQHPDGQEQLPLNFQKQVPPVRRTLLFADLYDKVKRNLGPLRVRSK